MLHQLGKHHASAEDDQTGGALGQVAVQEINYLQSTVATLDQLDDPKALRAALTRIEESYKRWLDAIQGRNVAPVANEPAPAQPAQTQQRAPAAPSTQGQWRIVE